MKHYDYNVITFKAFYSFAILLYMILITIQERIKKYVLGYYCFFLVLSNHDHIDHHQNIPFK